MPGHRDSKSSGSTVGRGRSAGTVYAAVPRRPSSGEPTASCPRVTRIPPLDASATRFPLTRPGDGRALTSRSDDRRMMGSRAQVGDSRIAAPGDRGDRRPAARRSRVPLVGGLGQLAGRAIGGVEATTPGVLTGQMPSVTTITDDAGAPIAHLFDQDRQVVASDRISTAMKAAIVAIEDRPLLRGVRARRPRRGACPGEQQRRRRDPGASTLTEQYIKNYDEYVAAQTPAQQLRATAPDLGEEGPRGGGRRAARPQRLQGPILTWYLNVVSFGNQAFGVQAAPAPTSTPPPTA